MSESTAGFLERAGAARVSVSGPDARDFLQRMITADVKSLATGQGTPSFLLERAGRVVDRVIVVDRETDFLLFGNDGREDAVVEWLEKYVIADDVQVRRLSGDTAAFTVLGSDWSVDSLPGREGLEPWCAALGAGPAGPRVCIRAEDLDGPSYHVLIPAAERDAFRAALAPLPELDDSRFQALRLIHGVPRFGHEYTERTIPLETGMLDAISFTKGCYVGQEVIARLHHQKRVKRALIHLRLDGPAVPEAGAEVMAGERSVGKITEAVAGPDHVAAFAYVAADAVRVQENGSVVAVEPLQVIVEQKSIPALIPGGAS
ncbi:MAG: glycine cleavage system protein T [Gemmatimonadota bacterium]|nr:MAG: glycine cleavage system protein T [Gemmatimonadota bacterium]